jgi:Ca2+-binding EF-hand superfamily protein
LTTTDNKLIASGTGTKLTEITNWKDARGISASITLVEVWTAKPATGLQKLIRSGVLDLAQATLFFREPLDFTIPSQLDAPVPFLTTLSQIAERKEFANTPEAQADISALIQRADAGNSSQSTEEDRPSGLATEMVTEAEAEAQRQQEAEQARESQIAFDRGDEQQNPWSVNQLKQTNGPAFYPLNDFKVSGTDSQLSAPPFLYLSNNYYRRGWASMGTRRIKNVTAVLEWIPNPSNVRFLPPPPASRAAKQALVSAFAAFDQDNGGSLELHELPSLLSALGEDVPTDQLDDYYNRLDTNGDHKVDLNEFTTFMLETSKVQQQGRFYSAISLSELATLRYLQNLTLQANLPSIASMSLRLLSGTLIQETPNFAPSSSHQLDIALQTFRFLNSEMTYNPGAMSRLLSSVGSTAVDIRKDFFEKVLTCRRRERRQWADTDLAKVLFLDNDAAFLRFRAQIARIRAGIQGRVGSLMDAFRRFDKDRNGWLEPAEFRAMLTWLDIGVSPGFIDRVFQFYDTDKNQMFEYAEFAQLLLL